MAFMKSAVGISAVAATVIFTGCGSSSSGGGGGMSTAEDLKAPVEVNASTISAAVLFADDLADGGFGPLAKAKAAVKSERPDLKDKTTETGTDVNDCEVSGTYTETWKDVEEDDNYDYEYVKVTYDNCVDNVSSTYNGIDYNLQTVNGTYARTFEMSYDSESGVRSEKMIFEDNYTEVYENNETETAENRTTVNKKAMNWDWTSTEGLLSAPAMLDEESITVINSGYEERKDTNASGTVFDGYKYAYVNLKITGEGTDDGITEEATYTYNGSYESYDINASGEFLTSGEYFNNLVATMVETGDEQNSTINGTLGSVCLGGAITLATTHTVQRNDVAYANSCDSDSGNTLPYAGVITGTGVGTGMATFSNDTTYSMLTITDSEDANTTYACWDEVEDAAPSCAD